MDAELTGRKVKVSKDLRVLADEGLARIEKIVGRGASAHVIFSLEKKAAIAEVTVHARQHKVVGLGEAPDLKIALKTALEKAEKQALRRKKSWLEKKRQGKSIGTVLPAPGHQELATKPEQTAARRKPAGNGKATAGLHIVSTPESMASRWMTLEEAVKEAESGNRDVFVFRDLAGDVKVLHCAGDGIVRLIEVS